MSASDRAYHRMKKLSILILISAVLLQCGPPKTVEEVIYRVCAPENLTARAGDRSVFLKWETPCPDSIRVAGYNIYISDIPLDKYRFKELPTRYASFNSAPYPGDANPEKNFETMEIAGLENGVKYYVSIRTVYTDGILSAASNEVEVITRPEGQFDLAYRYTGQNDGFSFVEGTAVPSDGDKNDLYFFVADGMDFLASPHRLNGFIRQSAFYSLGATTDIYQYQTINLDIEPVDRIPIQTGESYLIKTADGNYAKIRVEGADGLNKQRVLHVRYIYQTIRDLMRF